MPPAAQQRTRPNVEIVGGRVDEGVAPPHPSQTRMCSFPASGSSWESLAHDGADDTIRDSLATKVVEDRLGNRPCQCSYPLSLRGQVCEAQVLSHVSRQRFSPHGTPLSSVGSR